jgi:predicted nucleic acid-binding protein
MISGVVDTTVIVHLFRRNPDALTWYGSVSDMLVVRPLTWMEIIYGASGKAGQAKCKALLDQFAMEYPTPLDMDWAMQQMERFRFSHGVGTNDCLIASVCYRLQVPLYTHNLKHMQILLGKSGAIQPY